MTKEDLIKRRDALTLLHDCWWDAIEKAEALLHDCWWDAIEKADKKMKELPTIEAEPAKHGRWIEVQRINPTDRMAICECSECGDTVWVYDGQRTWNYCPNCGARMDEVEE